jgi:hypothetical protein
MVNAPNGRSDEGGREVRRRHALRAAPIPGCAAPVGLAVALGSAARGLSSERVVVIRRSVGSAAGRPVTSGPGRTRGTAEVTRLAAVRPTRPSVVR